MIMIYEWKKSLLVFITNKDFLILCQDYLVYDKFRIILNKQQGDALCVYMPVHTLYNDLLLLLILLWTHFFRHRRFSILFTYYSPFSLYSSILLPWKPTGNNETMSTIRELLPPWPHRLAIPRSILLGAYQTLHGQLWFLYTYVII